MLHTIRSALEARPEVVFAYLHGSFLTGRPFHDVDVAVYLRPGVEEVVSWFALDLAAELERTLAQMPGRTAARLPVDVRVLNRASLGFCYHVLGGKQLLSRDDAVHSRWAEQVWWRYLDLKPLQQRALKEAMTA